MKCSHPQCNKEIPKGKFLIFYGKRFCSKLCFNGYKFIYKKEVKKGKF